MVYSDQFKSLADFFNEYQVVQDAGNDPELTQFTGLRDKNGKDIYEGDVYISSDDTRNRNYYVYFIKGAFAGGLSMNNAAPLGWYVDEDCMDMVEEPTRIDWMEVIGNIYKNSELLEQPK